MVQERCRGQRRGAGRRDEAELVGPAAAAGLPHDHCCQFHRRLRPVPRHLAQRTVTGGGHQAGRCRGEPLIRLLWNPLSLLYFG